jgi:hypothetical protein
MFMHIYNANMLILVYTARFATSRKCQSPSIRIATLSNFLLHFEKKCASLSFPRCETYFWRSIETDEITVRADRGAPRISDRDHHHHLSRDDGPVAATTREWPARPWTTAAAGALNAGFTLRHRRAGEVGSSTATDKLLAAGASSDEPQLWTHCSSHLSNHKPAIAGASPVTLESFLPLEAWRSKDRWGCGRRTGAIVSAMDPPRERSASDIE